MKRSPLRRKTPLRRRRAEGADVEREPKPWAASSAARNREREQEKNRNMAALLHAMPARRGTYAGSTSGVPIPKPEPAKPGKRAPTKQEREWMDAIVRYGCIACRMDGRGFVPAAVHHILRAGRRIGHMHTLPLCDPGHHQNGQSMGLVSRHPWKARFEDQYGSEDFLLEQLRSVLAWQSVTR